MTNKSATPENAISRRHFLLSASLATTALGFEPLPAMGALKQENRARAAASKKLCLWYDRPAKAWMTEALPIGNGPKIWEVNTRAGESFRLTLAKKVDPRSVR